MSKPINYLAKVKSFKIWKWRKNCSCFWHCLLLVWQASALMNQVWIRQRFCHFHLTTSSDVSKVSTTNLGDSIYCMKYFWSLSKIKTIKNGGRSSRGGLEVERLLHKLHGSFSVDQSPLGACMNVTSFVSTTKLEIDIKDRLEEYSQYSFND